MATLSIEGFVTVSLSCFYTAIVARRASEGQTLSLKLMAFSQFLEYNKTTFSTECHDILPQGSDNVTAICIHPIYLRLKNSC